MCYYKIMHPTEFDPFFVTLDSHTNQSWISQTSCGKHHRSVVSTESQVYSPQQGAGGTHSQCGGKGCECTTGGRGGEELARTGQRELCTSECHSQKLPDQIQGIEYLWHWIPPMSGKKLHRLGPIRGLDGSGFDVRYPESEVTTGDCNGPSLIWTRFCKLHHLNGF